MEHAALNATVRIRHRGLRYEVEQLIIMAFSRGKGQDIVADMNTEHGRWLHAPHG